MKIILASLLTGVLFGVGLALSQMTNPDKVIAFLDLAGNWDPSLFFVMLGALTVTMICFRLILRRSQPVLGQKFYLPMKKDIDKPLLFGATIFGIGWGIAGYCPGPVIAGLGLGNPEAVTMVLAIYAGFMACRFMFERDNL